MTTEEMIESVIDNGVKAYRHNYKNCLEGRKIYRHEPVTLEGITFTCWREYAVYKTGQYIQGICPTIEVTVELDGNDSYLQVSMTDSERIDLSNKLYSFLKKAKLVC